MRDHSPAFSIWLATRVGVSLLALLAGLYIPGRAPAGTAPYVNPPMPAFWDRLFGVWSRWDGLWYLQIATAGYNPNDGTTAFFPLYPMLIGGLGRILGERYLWAGVIVSSLCMLAALILLYRLVREQYAGAWSGGLFLLGERTLLFLAIFPFAFFFWAIYSESLFLLLAILMFYAAWRKQWLLAGLALAGAFWTRPFGIVLLPCLLWEIWIVVRSGEKGDRRAWFAAWPAIVVPGVAGLGLLLWSALALGNPLVFLSTQSEWNRAFSWPWETIINAFRIAAATPFEYQEENQSWTYLAALLLFIGLAIAGWWRKNLRGPHALYLTLGLLFPLFSATPRNPLLSMPRFELVLFPAFIVLALVARRDWLFYLVVVTSLMLQALYLIRFANWFWVA